MSQNETIQVEIHGVKMEVDLRYAKRIDTLQVGSRVKCLIKSQYGSGAQVYPGIVVGFEPFPSLPTIQVAYLDLGYGAEMLKFFAFNAESKDFEIVPDVDNTSIEVHKADVLKRFDKEIEKKKLELQELQQRKQFFYEKFAVYFSETFSKQEEPLFG